jgi:cobalt/nickel transport system permease protein
VQLLFLHRYLFVLLEEAQRMTRAHALRKFDTRGPGLKTFSSIIGYLLLRATDRAERIHLAMRCRGFDGKVRLLTATRFRTGDLLFILGWSGLFLVLRLYNIPAFIGPAALGIIP